MKKFVTVAVVMAAMSAALLASAQAESYSASRWIWGAAEAHSHETYSFRGTFNVPGPVKKATIRIYVDDGAEYWMNGTSVKRQESGAAVKEGANVLAIAASNVVSAAGIILRGDIELADGSCSRWIAIGFAAGPAPRRTARTD